jgi:hypothetical protein
MIFSASESVAGRADRKNYRKSHRAGKERSSTGAQRYVTDSLSLQGRELAVVML